MIYAVYVVVVLLLILAHIVAIVREARYKHTDMFDEIDTDAFKERNPGVDRKEAEGGILRMRIIYAVWPGAVALVCSYAFVLFATQSPGFDISVLVWGVLMIAATGYTAYRSAGAVTRTQRAPNIGPTRHSND